MTYEVDIYGVVIEITDNTAEDKLWALAASHGRIINDLREAIAAETFNPLGNFMRPTVPVSILEAIIDRAVARAVSICG